MFEAFPKISRLFRDCVVTEKLDGTNAQVIVAYDENRVNVKAGPAPAPIASVDGLSLYAGSRKRLIFPGDDNFGFAAWVKDNAEELVKLGPGRHFGEWWGAGIQRGYDLDHKRFSLFNVTRWNITSPPPECCHTVPVLVEGGFCQDAIMSALTHLSYSGSLAAPGFMDPEGIVVFHSASSQLFKYTLGGDGHKG